MRHVVVIPVYKDFDRLESYEKASLRQCFTILKAHAICLACPTGFNPAPYAGYACSFGVKITVRTFPRRYFRSTATYNNLLLNKRFYKSFLAYDYMLIYQTDAFVFSDELDDWCRLGLDYIGAPWMEGHREHEGVLLISGVGNGGFSLRNISRFYEMALHIGRFRRMDAVLRYTFLTRIFSLDKLLLWCWRLAYDPRPGFSIKMLTSRYRAYNEDGVWCLNIAASNRDFVVADAEVATRFSFEMNPELLYEKNNGRLPFGCHAFMKYNPAFWSQHIQLS